jgi:hypothetical protein
MYYLISIVFNYVKNIIATKNNLKEKNKLVLNNLL